MGALVNDHATARREWASSLLVGAVDRLLEASSDVQGVLVTTSDGLPIISALPDSVDESQLAAMGASMLALGDRSAHEIGLGEMSQLMTTGEHGHVLLADAGGGRSLLVVASENAKLGLIRFELKAMAEALQSIFSAESREVVDLREDREPEIINLSETRPRA
jgi:predicted regulator of Ras-like GTPase activity (Roadblock/LC7/MglB family)